MLLVALGIVFGDIGTSPLYAVRECFSGEFGIPITNHNILGVLSLIFWSLTIIVSVKYLTFILRANNDGEGGIMALTALLRSGMQNSKSKYVLITFGLFATCLLYGDGIITPAISVLSAVEGLQIIAPNFHSFVIPISLFILTCLFLLQKRGTDRIGSLFGPIILVWFSTLALLGLFQIIRNPEVLMALMPWYGISFLMHSGVTGFMVLGAVFLVVTGAEVLYADLGHFGTKPIRLTWFFIVLPALVLNYFGQGALLMRMPEAATHPFYAMVPGWAMIPMVFLATLATIIASQAVISGVFSLTSQAVSLGYLPRLRIVHTSAKLFGQIYAPQVNWLLMLATLLLVLSFGTSGRLAAAYGIAVVSQMVITSVLFYFVARTKWHWNRLAAGLPVIIFLIVDLAFFSANFSKIFHGAWFPLVIAVLIFSIMTTWHRGRKILASQLRSMAITMQDFVNNAITEDTQRIKGKAIFLSGQTDTVPVALLHNLKHNKVIHSEVGILHFVRQDVPRVSNLHKLKTTKLHKGFYIIEMSYGYMENPNVPMALSLANDQGVNFPIGETSFFLGREKIVTGKPHLMSSWRSHLFGFLTRIAYDSSSYYGIPERQVMEVGTQLRM